MPDIEEMVMAMRHIEEMLERLQKYNNNILVKGDLVGTDEFLEDTRISLETAFQVLEKRVGYHLEAK